MSGSEKVDLADIRVECVGGDGYMDPYSEYIRELSPESAANLNCYTYITLDLVNEIYEGEKPENLVGWYKWARDVDWEAVISEGDTSLKLAAGEKMIDVYQAFLGNFYGTCAFHFICAGGVVCDPTEFETGSAKYYFFHNYLPTTINLTDIEVECEGGDGYMDPYSEYIRDLSPESAANVNCYTYITLDLVNEIYEGANPENLVGWYKWEKTADWETIIAEGDTTLKIEGDADVEMAPGKAFLGNFYGTCSFHLKFPNPVEPVK